MKRETNYRYIEEHLGVLAHRIVTNGKLNDLTLHLRSEDFYQHFLNTLFGWQLENFNLTEHNAAAIDLICHTQKLVVQVSATNTKEKVNSALAKDKIKAFAHYRFKFCSIAKSAGKLRSTAFNNKHGINFNPANDILDKESLLKEIGNLKIIPQNTLYQFIKDELGRELDPVKKDTAIAAVINVISKVPIVTFDPSTDAINFQIDKKITYNDLVDSRESIELLSVNSFWLEQKYSEFDSEAVNRSASIFLAIKNMYEVERRKRANADEVFIEVVERVKELVANSNNLQVSLYEEELDSCARIVVIDAFMRCKIFEKPPLQDAVA